MEIVLLGKTKIVSEYLDHVLPTLSDVVAKQLDAVDAHQTEQRVMTLLEFRFPEFLLHTRQLAKEHLDEEVPAPAGGLKKPGIDALGLVLDQVEHRFDHPGRREDLTVVGNTLS